MVSSVILTGLSILTCAIAQDSAASRAASAPAAETGPASRPAEVRARHPRIGIRVDTIALEREKLARVEEVKPNSPAEKAGIKVGDIIMTVGGEEIRDDKAYRDALGRKRAGDEVAMHIRRGGEELDLTVTLPDRPFRSEPESVTIQHVLIGFGERAATPAGKKRTPEEARKLADEILKKAKNGANFDELVKSYSEDAGSVGKTPPGSYAIMQDGRPKPTPDARSWSEWVPAFSALSFALDVGEIAMTAPDPELSPFGYHIIKRIQ
jgi:membrane-associated protease RseP (regulator of RpoE activity)